MIDIMNQKTYRLDDDVFFIINSVDKPHLFVKCVGKIINKHQHKDNIIYLLKLVKVFTNVDHAKIHLHRRIFKTRKADTKIASMKKLYCMEFFDKPETLSSNICDIFKHHLFVVPSVFVTDDYDAVNRLHDSAKEVISSKLKSFIFEIDSQ